MINSDGLNTNWQLNVVKGLQGIINQLQNVTVDTTDVELLLSAKQRIPNLIRVTGSGSITPKVYSFSVANVGTANGVILGQTIKAGETLNFSAGSMDNFYASETITYNGSGTELLIIYNS